MPTAIPPTSSPTPNQRHAGGGVVRLAQAMRAVLLALLLILPLQVSWAAMARYCAHGTVQAQPEGQHPGHHSHQHRTEPGSTAQPNGLAFMRTAATQLPDADCGFCHASVAPYAVAQSRCLGAGRQASGLVSSRSPPFSTRADHRIDRPNWMATGRTGVMWG